MATRNRYWTIGLALLGLAVFALPATADWNPGDPYKMHYPQLPDLTTSGMDLFASSWDYPPRTWTVLADDWQCNATGPVSDIHIWGSWLSNNYPFGDAANVTFNLAIYSDSTQGSFSHPDQPLWQQTFQPGQFAVRPYPTSGGGATERFYDPTYGDWYFMGTDSQVWQYNFTNLLNPLTQEQGHTYWLAVWLRPMDESNEVAFGWKTTNPGQTAHFQDDAVVATTSDFGVPPAVWLVPMEYPFGPFLGQSIDLAFVITPEPGTIVMLVGVGLVGLAAFARRRRR